MMRLSILGLICAAWLAAADVQRLALEAKGQADFERVQKALTPQLRDAAACIQSQAALLPIAPPEGLSAAHYRKGYCTLAAAGITHQSSEFSAAAAEFDKAIENWPARTVNAKNRRPEPLPSGLKVLAAIAGLQAATGDEGMDRMRAAVASAVAAAECSSPLMEAGFCDGVLRLGRLWLGWIDLRHDEVDAAVRDLAGAEPSGFAAWAAGRRAFRDGNYREASAQYRNAVETWEAAQRRSVSTLLERLGPAPDLRAAYADLGSAQLLAGDQQAAVESLSRAIKEDPWDARALFLRGRARELAGQSEAALADYNLASRAAFAAAQDLASGEAHLYRGILLYHRKDYARAEDEFASALNFAIPATFREDAAAWRHLAAVAAGSCEASRASLERALAAVSPYFPREEARARSAACAAASAVTPRLNPPK